MMVAPLGGGGKSELLDQVVVAFPLSASRLLVQVGISSAILRAIYSVIQSNMELGETGRSSIFTRLRIVLVLVALALVVTDGQTIASINIQLRIG